MTIQFNTPEWNENRILRRAKQHQLFQTTCVAFSALPEVTRKSIAGKTQLIGKPLLAFYDTIEKWTVVTTETVVTCHHGNTSTIRLDEVPSVIAYGWEDGEAPPTKHTATYLKLDGMKICIWAPAGYELHALWSILQMFSPSGG